MEIERLVLRLNLRKALNEGKWEKGRESADT